MTSKPFDKDKYIVCAYYGRRDLFWGGIYAHPRTSVVALLKHLKQEPLLDDRTRAKNMLWLHQDRVDEAKRYPERTEQNKRIKNLLKRFNIEARSTEEYIVDFFKPSRNFDDLSTKSTIWEFKKRQIPDHSVSTFLIYLRLNPKLHLAGADLSGHVFADDYNFFEGADLSDTDLRNTTWKPKTTSIAGANLSGADLRGATGMTPTYLATAIIDEKTKLPEGITRPAIKKERVKIEGNGPSGAGGTPTPSP